MRAIRKNSASLPDASSVSRKMPGLLVEVHGRINP